MSYKSVLSMVEDVSHDMNFIKKFKEKLNGKRIFIYFSPLTSEIHVFKKLKDAKEYGERQFMAGNEWKKDKENGILSLGSCFILKKKILKG